MSLHF